MKKSFFEENHQNNREEKASGEGVFTGAFLLSEDRFSAQRLRKDLFEDWGIEIGEEAIEEEGTTIIGDVGSNRFVVTKFPIPVPNGKAEVYAKNNERWLEAVTVAKAHQVHLFVRVLGAEGSAIEKGLLYAKVMASCCKQKKAIGVLTNGVVYAPQVYQNYVAVIKDGQLPILSWIWFGMYSTATERSVYTRGMDAFGKENIELFYEPENAESVGALLVTMVTRVIEGNLDLEEGKSLEFPEGSSYFITYGKGIALPEEHTFKSRHQR